MYEYTLSQLVHIIYLQFFIKENTKYFKTGFKEKTYVTYVTLFFFNEIQTAAYIEIGILH